MKPDDVAAYVHDLADRPEALGLLISAMMARSLSVDEVTHDVDRALVTWGYDLVVRYGPYVLPCNSPSTLAQVYGTRESFERFSVSFWNGNPNENYLLNGWYRATEQDRGKVCRHVGEVVFNRMFASMAGLKGKEG